jgi:protein-disulfide isomerase
MTRREFLQSASAIALMGGAIVVAGDAALAFIRQAGAQTAPAPPPATTVPTDQLMAPGPLPDRAEGAADAPVTVVEYASMTCPHCAHFHNTTYPELKKRYIDTGKVRFIFREFPLDQLAAMASMLARCGGDTDKDLQLIDTLFKQQNKWMVRNPVKPLFGLAQKAGFTEQSFKACLSNQELLTGLEQARDRAADQLGVDSTPTFFINGAVLRGAASIEEMAKLIDPYLKTEEQPPASRATDEAPGKAP